MRKVKKTKKTITITKDYAVVCDLCGDECKRVQYDNFSDFSKDDKSVQTTSVNCETGCVDKGGKTEALSYDICPACFKGVLVPWLKSQGAKARKMTSKW